MESSNVDHDAILLIIDELQGKLDELRSIAKGKSCDYWGRRNADSVLNKRQFSGWLTANGFSKCSKIRGTIRQAKRLMNDGYTLEQIKRHPSITRRKHGHDIIDDFYNLFSSAQLGIRIQ